MKSAVFIRKQGSLTAALLLSGFIMGAVEAQNISLSFHHLAREQGLSHAQNYFAFQDAYGFAWVSTDEGLNRFDGQSVEHLAFDASGPSSPLSGKVSSRCFEDADRNLWFSTFSGVGCYRRASGRFEFFLPKEPDLKGFYAFHLDADRRLWVKAGAGEQAAVFLFDTRSGQFQRMGPLQGERFAIVADAQGRVKQIVASMLPDKKPGLTLTDLSTWKTDTIEFSLMSNGQTRRSSPVKNVLVEGDSVVWAALYNGLGKYHIRTGKAVAILKREASVETEFGWAYDVAAYDASRLLVGCTDGLLVFDRQNNRFVQQMRHHAQVPQSLRAGEVTGLYRDPSDNLWLSGPGGGLAFAHLFKNKFQAVSETVGTPVASFFEDHLRRIWCSTADSGAYVFDQRGGKLLHTNELENLVQPDKPFPLYAMSNFWQDSLLSLWGFCETYAFRWKEAAQRFEFRAENAFGVPSSPSDFLRAYCLLADGTRLVAQGRSFFEIKTSGTKALLLPRPDLQAFQLQEVTAIFQNKKGQVFLADNQYRVVVLDWSKSPAQKIADIQGFAACNSFVETDDGLVWAATSKGLFRIHPDSFEGTLLTEKTDGCPNEEFYNVLPDRQGALWLTGNNGLVRYDPQGKTHHRFGTADGLLSSQFSPHAALRASASGDFWVGGKNGANVFQPAHIRLLDARPQVQLTRLLVNDTAFHAGTDLSLLEHLDLSYTQNTLSFQFAALDFSAPGQNQYFYRMVGIERDAVPNGSRGFVRYANLPPGAYTFEVWATNSDGVLSPEPRRLHLHIRAPFWQTWWFYLLCALTVGGLVYGWLWYRLQQALKIERMRVEISSDLHDDVGTLLAGLAMQSEALELTAPEKDKAKLRRISDISRNAMAHMRDTVWAIDARKDKVENLLDRMREHAEETLTSRDIRFDIQVDSLSMKQNLPTYIRQNIYLIYKEAVTNAAKHSNGDMVTVSLKKSGEGFEMRICDNGQVAEKTYKTTGLGTSNMAMRAEKIGGRLEMERENGFCVVLRLGRLG